ncbi:DUF418 domain-containing protein [Nocardia sp. CDC153]|uniref:DUF418 domain-containing protein n=1 Tax=Nocardia sp. CDC153 TaxID=3112167 RepID=UPI002DB65DFA|nr:DUF418 domain-containing protein [Nocardia sp. CDC153]MEC3952454.1 DUF418 domain-containing protein [Nocardia sp. CDC153]
MTSIQPPQEASPPERAGGASTDPSTGRLVGVDLARALAVFGMYTVHVGPPLSATHGVGSWIRYLADGRSSVLFATLAGFSLMLIAGRRQPKTGRAGRRAKARIAIRAVVLIALGTVMAIFYGDVVILAFYGVYFLLAIPLTRLRAETLAIIATALALTTPQLAFVLKSLLSEPIQQAFDAYDPLKQLSGVGVLDLLLTGLYPTITWMPFVIAGMALARLDLALGTVRARVAALGATLTVLGYGLSRLLGGPDALRSTAESGPPDPGSGSLPPPGDGAFTAQGPVSSLLMAGPHSGTTFDIVGSLGVAILVIVGATAAMDRLPRLRRLATPIIAVGTMSLTAYVGHFVGMSALALMPDDETSQTSWTPLLLFILAAVLFATIWFRFFRRGPLEYLLNTATQPAKHLR